MTARLLKDFGGQRFGALIPRIARGPRPRQMRPTPLRAWRHVVLLLVLASACQSSDRPFWQGGRHYELTLVAQERPELIPSAKDFHQPIRDTLVVELTVDSVHGSKVYGFYSGSIRGFAIRVGSPTAAGRAFQAEIDADSVHAQLSPSVNDARLLLNGVIQADTVIGTWFTEAAPRTRGVFTLNRR